jgi:hypothetical protein
MPTVRVVCAECGDETSWHFVYDRYNLPRSFRQTERDTTITCEHWRDVHVSAFQEAFKLRRPPTQRRVNGG